MSILMLSNDYLNFTRNRKCCSNLKTAMMCVLSMNSSWTSQLGGSLSVVIADWIRVVDGRIAEQKIYYDPREFVKAFPP
jgi:hypothetical protein